MVTSSKETHVPLVIVHLNTFAPTPNPVTPDVGLPGVVIVPVPLTNVHKPVPKPGEFPAKVAVVAQTVWSGPASEVTGAGSLVIVTSSVELGHEPFVIVQRNVFAPTDKPVTPDVGDPGVVTDPDPAITVHAPVPTVGILPAKAAVVAHTLWSGPAFDVVGDASRVIVTSSAELGHEPFVIVQRNVFAPTDKPVTPDVGEPGVVTDPVPAITVQAPVPTVGVLPAKVAVVAQTV
jgi:hypothetical protein